ncbi:MAG: permease [Chthoniobacterales bacterium]
MSWFSFNPHDFSISFLSILFEGVPYLFLGTLLSGLIDAFLPAQALERWLPKNAALAIGVAGVLGFFLPMCECGVIPVIRRMLKKGLPIAPAVTYLLASPIINPVVALSTYAAFRGQEPGTVLAFRMILGFLIACIFGAIVLRLPKQEILLPNLLEPAPQRFTSLFAAVPDDSATLDDLTAAEPRPSIRSRLLAALRTASFDFLDVAFYLIMGAILAAIFNTAIHRETIILPLAGNIWLATFSLEGLASILSLCSTSDAFIAANFVAFPLAAKLAFMVLGPMMDVKLFLMYGLVFRKKFTIAMAASLFVGIGLLCIFLAKTLP